MSLHYTIRFRQSARDERNVAYDYGERFNQDFDRWLEEIRQAAERNDQSFSIDFRELLEEGLAGETAESSWKISWRRWRRLTASEKLKSLLALLRTRRPPWEIRSTSRHFYRILGSFDCEVTAIYEIDHTSRQVVFTKFIGVPGQG